MEFTLSGGTIVSHDATPHTGDLNVRDQYLVRRRGTLSIDLRNQSYIYPSLINTHDHLQGNYLPAVGPPQGSCYLTWLPWDNDLKASPTFAERSKLSREDLYALSGYKCLFSGVTTVSDHVPHDWNQEILSTLPIRAIAGYSLAHECSSYDLRWGDGIEPEHDRAVQNKWPFITHLCEGFDSEAMHGVQALENFRALDKYCLLIHCISFSDADIKKAARAGASVAWCGRSNMFMFNTTAKIRKMIKAGVNVTIGTDSSATGSVNMLDELKYDRELYRGMYGEDLPAKKMFDMVTWNAAKAFRMQDRLGTLGTGKLADILALKINREDPYENLIDAGMEDIELLVLEGTPIYGELRFLDIFGGKLPSGYTQVEIGGRMMFVKGDPAGLYGKARRTIGFKKMLDYIPFDPAFE